MTLLGALSSKLPDQLPHLGKVPSWQWPWHLCRLFHPLPSALENNAKRGEMVGAVKATLNRRFVDSCSYRKRFINIGR